MTAVVRSLDELHQAIAKLTTLNVGYTRVSSELSTQDSSITRQIEDFVDYGCNLILVERESGTNIEGQSLYNALISLISEGKVKKIAATTNHRLNRNQTEMNFFYNLCGIQGVEWNLLDEPELNSTSPYAKKLREERAYYAEKESKELSFRQKKANIRAEKNLKVLSRIPCFGYRFTKERKYEINYALSDLSNVVGYFEGKPYATGELAFKVVKLFLQHKSQNQCLKKYKIFVKSLRPENETLVAKELNRTLTWLGNWLRDPTIQGKLVYGKYKEIYYGDKLEKKKFTPAPPSEWRIHHNQHEPIVRPSEAREIARILKVNQNFGHAMANAKKDPAHPESLSSILRCCRCGQSLISRTNCVKGKRYRYYYCLGRLDHRCKSKGIGEQTLVKLLVAKIIYQAEELADMLNNSAHGQITPDEQKLILLKQEAEDAERKYKLTGIGEYLNLRLIFQQQITEIEAARETAISNVKDKQDLVTALSNPLFWSEMSQVDLHRYLKAIVLAAHLDNQKILLLDLNL